ncbi:MAG: nucleotidyl transferase AbiEii/AbiGii toxin family protein [Bacteroidota bacterium]
MMDLKEIVKCYPEYIQQQEFKKDMLREYLQHEILKIIFESKHALVYTFLGGTCLRLVYGTERFSEDLDFGNIGLSVADFEETGRAVKRGLELLGYQTTIKFSHKDAFHCKVTFPGILYNYGLSGHKEARIFIKLDTEKQNYDYQRDLVRIQKFGVDADIFVTPPALLTSQKIAAVLGRKRPKGRDFYDLVWLLTQGHLPDYGYLKLRFDLTTPAALRTHVLQYIAPFDFDQLTRDVAPFLFRKESREMVRRFPDFWRRVKL